MKLKNLLRDERGEVSMFTIFVVAAINLVMAFLLFYGSVQINGINIYNGIRMELNNLSGSIYADTYRSQRESNLDSYMNTLYSSSAYLRQLESSVLSELRQKIELQNDDYRLSDMALEFRQETDRIRYVFRCDAEFYVRMFGRDYPAVTREITLTGSHNTKF